MAFNNIPLPPPLPVHTLLLQSNKQDVKKNEETLKIASWANEAPELQKACIRYACYLYKEPYLFKYSQIDSQLQEGPTCGLLILSLLLQRRLSVNDLKLEAVAKGFTNNGEMFSVNNLSKLLTQSLEKLNMQNYYTEVKTGSLTDKAVISFLVDGGMILVPYDADANHSPCLKNGHKAHWALIVGIILDDDPDKLKSSEQLNDNVYVLAKHGKSLHLAMWKLNELEKSNQNLFEFSPKRETDEMSYVLPDDGIDGANGLRNQFILFRYTQ